MCRAHYLEVLLKSRERQPNDLYNLPVDRQEAVEAVHSEESFFACLLLISFQKENVTNKMQFKT